MLGSRNWRTAPAPNQPADDSLARVATKGQRPFSLGLYLLIVFALSWPFQIAFAFFLWEGPRTISFILSSMAMIMVTVGTFIAGRFFFRDGFARAGWRWGTPKQYALAFGLVALIWVVPTVLEGALGLRTGPSEKITVQVLASFLFFFTITLVPAFSEEFGWRGYMLRHLADRHTVRRALLLHAFIWWAWHLPTLVGIALQGNDVEGGPLTRVAIVAGFSLIPSMMNGVIFGYVWASTQSLAVATVYHSAFDEARDTLERSIGFGPFVDLYWQNGLLTLLGAVLLWKGNWSNLKHRADGPVQLLTTTNAETRKVI